MFSREFIDNFLKDYSEAEKNQIQKDLEIVKSITFDNAKENTDTSKAPVYLATAGGPGTAKTTTLETFLVTHNLGHFVYVDPDQVSLKNMNFTYRKSLTNYDFAMAPSTYDALKKAYDKWRAASNYICHSILETAFGNDDGKGIKYSIAHGTTSTSPYIGSFHKKIKALGYRIVLLLCYSPDEMRKNAIEKRQTEQAFVQADPSDIISKGVYFPERFDNYFDYADEIIFYWNEEIKHQKLPMPCAKFINNPDNPSLTILNSSDWVSFCNKYLKDVKQHNINICERFISLTPANVKSYSSNRLFSALNDSEEHKSSTPTMYNKQN
ncbi:MAG: hypothetical protein SFW66_02805 [Gammaproteobacteria bacterium]|nr:hypothetical protein [Gammaproteobacteria bacterium]